VSPSNPMCHETNTNIAKENLRVVAKDSRIELKDHELNNKKGYWVVIMSDTENPSMEKMGTKSMKELNKKSSNRYFSWEKMQKKIK